MCFQVDIINILMENQHFFFENPVLFILIDYNYIVCDIVYFLYL